MISYYKENKSFTLVAFKDLAKNLFLAEHIRDKIPHIVEKYKIFKAFYTGQSINSINESFPKFDNKNLNNDYLVYNLLLNKNEEMLLQRFENAHLALPVKNMTLPNVDTELIDFYKSVDKNNIRPQTVVFMLNKVGKSCYGLNLDTNFIDALVHDFSTIKPYKRYLPELFCCSIESSLLNLSEEILNKFDLENFDQKTQENFLDALLRSSFLPDVKKNILSKYIDKHLIDKLLNDEVKATSKKLLFHEPEIFTTYLYNLQDFKYLQDVYNEEINQEKNNLWKYVKENLKILDSFISCKILETQLRNKVIKKKLPSHKI